MATERQKFMYEQSLKDFAKLQNNIGQRVKINYLTNGNSLEALGTLKAVEPFKSITFTGGEVPFVSREKMIRAITNSNGELLYDRTYIIPSNAKVVAELGRYKLAIMGAEQPQKGLLKIQDNLRQDT